MKCGGAVLTWLLCVASVAVAQEGPVTARLALAEGKTSYHSGEPITLELVFNTTESGQNVNTTTTQLASPIDTILLSPVTGAFPWLADYSRGNRYSPDYAAIGDLKPGQPFTIPLPLNALYRFDQPGHYTVRVETWRVSSGGILANTPAGKLTTNEVEFDVELMSNAEEAEKAQQLESQIRSATDLRSAQRLAEQLQWLTGDPSTQVKLSLFLHPKTFHPFGVDVTFGLWNARNRTRVVTALEQAMVDPALPVDSMLRLAVQLKARLAAPYDPQDPKRALPTEAIEQDYVRRIAATLPQRSGQGLTTTAITLLVSMAGRKQTETPEFAAVRETLVTHFAEINEYKVDWVLNGYGKYLDDARLIPALENRLRSLRNPMFSGSRAAMIQQLERLNALNKDLLVADICDPQMLTNFDVLRAAPFDSLSEVDACLREQLHQFAAGGGRNDTMFQHKASLAARFGTAANVDDFYKLYSDSKASTGAAPGALSGAARGAMLAYLARYDGRRARPLLEAAMPGDAPHLESNVSYALFRAYYSPALEEFLRVRLATGPAGQAGEAAWRMSEHGPADDADFIRKRLVMWRKQWSKSNEVPTEEAGLESELVNAILHGKSWKLSDAEDEEFRQGCVTDRCRERVKKYAHETHQ
ncbi:MAG TPA: hypothetical protein VF311_09225 [Terriglobales bacterium]